MKTTFTILVSLSLLFTANAQIALTSQSEVNAATNYQNLSNFYLYIENDTTLPNGEQIYDLSPLQNLKSLGGLIIKYTKLTNLNGLQNVHTISQSLTISENDSLSDISAIFSADIGGTSVSLCPLLSSNNFINFSPSNLYLNNLKGVTNLVFNKAAQIQLLNIKECDNLEEITFNLTDTAFVLQVEDNSKLKQINFNLTANTAYMPTTAPELYSASRSLMIRNNPSLSEISCNPAPASFITIRAINNASLDYALCNFKSNLEKIDELGKAEFGSSLWVGFSKNFIDNNLPPFDTFSGALSADCSQYTTIKEQSLTDEDVSNFSIYPNPYTGGALQLSGVKTGSQIVLYDIVGKEVYRTQYTGTTISLPHVNKGLYLIEAKNLKGHREYVKLYID
jgi:hypothetical protein